MLRPVAAFQYVAVYVWIGRPPEPKRAPYQIGYAFCNPSRKLRGW
jgi:hypothetical protein